MELGGQNGLDVLRIRGEDRLVPHDTIHVCLAHLLEACKDQVEEELRAVCLDGAADMIDAKGQAIRHQRYWFAAKPFSFSGLAPVCDDLGDISIEAVGNDGPDRGQKVRVHPGVAILPALGTEGVVGSAIVSRSRAFSLSYICSWS